MVTGNNQLFFSIYIYIATYRRNNVFSILFYRYCENIGRCHKSNNIYWIVDLNKKKMYQKCHDEDCSGFLSTPKNLPEEIAFKFDIEGDAFISHAIIDENIV